MDLRHKPILFLMMTTFFILSSEFTKKRSRWTHWRHNLVFNVYKDINAKRFVAGAAVVKSTQSIKARLKLNYFDIYVNVYAWWILSIVLDLQCMAAWNFSLMFCMNICKTCVIFHRKLCVFFVQFPRQNRLCKTERLHTNRPGKSSPPPCLQFVLELGYFLAVKTSLFIGCFSGPAAMPSVNFRDFWDEVPSRQSQLSVSPGNSEKIDCRSV